MNILQFFLLMMLGHAMGEGGETNYCESNPIAATRSGETEEDSRENAVAVATSLGINTTDPTSASQSIGSCCCPSQCDCSFCQQKGGVCLPSWLSQIFSCYRPCCNSPNCLCFFQSSYCQCSGRCANNQGNCRGNCTTTEFISLHHSCPDPFCKCCVRCLGNCGANRHCRRTRCPSTMRDVGTCHGSSCCRCCQACTGTCGDNTRCRRRCYTGEKDTGTCHDWSECRCCKLCTGSCSTNGNCRSRCTSSEYDTGTICNEQTGCKCCKRCIGPCSINSICKGRCLFTEIEVGTCNGSSGCKCCKTCTGTCGEGGNCRKRCFSSEHELEQDGTCGAGCKCCKKSCTGTCGEGGYCRKVCYSNEPEQDGTCGDGCKCCKGASCGSSCGFNRICSSSCRGSLLGRASIKQRFISAISHCPRECPICCRTSNERPTLSPQMLQILAANGIELP